MSLPPASRASRGRPLFAAYYAHLATSIESGPIGAARHDLLTQARGVVVDLGAGIGLNLPHLGLDVTTVHLVEPDPHMVRRLRPVLPEHAVIHEVGAEHLPLPDASADTVLATLTLCTVDDVGAAVAEIRRVLRPDGQILVLEHVRSSSPAVAAWQRRIRPLWRLFGGGCNPDRDTRAALGDAGFETSGLRRLDVPGSALTREWVTGISERVVG